MDREYRVLNNGTAVLLTRQPELERGEVLIAFTGAPDGATAIFECNGDSIYRLLKDGICIISADKLSGPVAVTLAVLDGSARPKKWICEELVADVREDRGGVILSPNDANLPERVTELKLENEELRNAQKNLENAIKALEEKLTSIYEGYDFT